MAINALYLEAIGKGLALAGAIVCARPFFADYRAKTTAIQSTMIEGATEQSRVFVETATTDAEQARDEPRQSDLRHTVFGLKLVVGGFAIDALVIGLKLLNWAT